MKRILLLIVGVALIAFGVHTLTQAYATNQISQTITGDLTYWRPPMGLPGELRTFVIAAKVEYPEQVVVGDSFLITLHISVIEGTEYIGVLSRDNLPGPHSQPPPVETKDVNLQDLFFQLQMQGINASPDQSCAVSKDGVIQWSAMAEGPGNFEGLITFDVKAAKGKSPEDFLAAPFEQFEFDHPVHLSIRASTPLFQWPRIAGAVITFLGSLATLPGLLSFRRSLASDQPKTGPPLIILPGDKRYNPPE
ncbi:MAG: hypothetical protein KDA69_13445 [Planctomycetaceae bacterium]|nr:hypothetical protein [Planctomycetaceae bacterium]